MEFKFNKGEQLEATSTVADLNKGDIVTAEQDVNSDGSDLISVRRVSDNQLFRGVYARRFKKAEVEADGFSVGDTVEVIYGGAGVSSVDMGKRAKVIGVKKSGFELGASGALKTLMLDGESFTYPHYQDKRRIVCQPKSVKKVNVVDFTKPLFTAEGTPVELVTTTGRDVKFPVLAYEGKATEPSKFNLDGISKLGVARRNLTNVVPKAESVQYHNVYKNASGRLYTGDGHATAEKARAAAQSGAVGLKKIVLTEGQFDA